MIFINQLLGYLDIPGYLCRKIGFMKKNKPYKEQEPMVPNVGEPVVVWVHSACRPLSADVQDERGGPPDASQNG